MKVLEDRVFLDGSKIDLEKILDEHVILEARCPNCASYVCAPEAIVTRLQDERIDALVRNLNWFTGEMEKLMLIHKTPYEIQVIKKELDRIKDQLQVICFPDDDFCHKR